MAPHMYVIVTLYFKYAIAKWIDLVFFLLWKIENSTDMMTSSMETFSALLALEHYGIRGSALKWFQKLYV